MSRAEIIAIVIIAAVTVLIRTLPFIITDIFHRRTDSRILSRLSELLTPALIGMLVVYCLKDISFGDNTALSAAIALAVCVASYIWKKNTLLSILVPTLIYMVLTRVI
ncbi:MAG: AzlD domain-containing protein [Spirochaetales bacterium]|nr:AzlD domain-containing protein [Spirochaetales bacterium]MBQ4500641.1 AzlD domain-containing protein [Spirochaetales bacterium]MBQ6124428.1 AzlD domain-containing protein [Spirochaetales bacterium]